jgi:hypothetical protein
VLLQMVAKDSRTWRIKAAQALLGRKVPLDERGRALIEAAALELLEDEALSAAAAELLGTVGGRDVLAALVRFEHSAARAAAEAIRARHRELAGGLSLAGREGQLSEATRVREPG